MRFGYEEIPLPDRSPITCVAHAGQDPCGLAAELGRHRPFARTSLRGDMSDAEVYDDRPNLTRPHRVPSYVKP